MDVDLTVFMVNLWHGSITVESPWYSLDKYWLYVRNIWLMIPMDSGGVASGKLPWHNDLERSTIFLMGKLTISMAIFNSYVTNYQRVAI